MKSLIFTVAAAFLFLVWFVSIVLIHTRNVDVNTNVKHGPYLEWVRDPNLGTYYYGWYEPNGSAFNCVETATNKRLGTVKQNTVPVYMWQRVQ